jgi:hypothetical protein
MTCGTRGLKRLTEKKKRSDSYWAERDGRPAQGVGSSGLKGMGRLGKIARRPAQTRLGLADRLGFGSTGRLGAARLDGPKQRPRFNSSLFLPSLSLTGGSRRTVQRLPLTGGARPSVRRQIQCGRTGSGAAAGLCGRVCVQGRLREAGVRRARNVAVLAAVSARGEGLVRWRRGKAGYKLTEVRLGGIGSGKASSCP